MSDPIARSCHTDYRASKSSGYRPDSAVRWIVLHDTEGGTAKSIAQYFASSAAQGSTHLVVDDDACYRVLTNNQVPWGAHGANYNGFHIEQCGYAKWSRAEWLKHIKTLRRAAYKTALHCRKFNVPVRFVVAADLKTGKKGVTTHAECSKAFGGSHWDPGSGWPRVFFMAMVKGYSVALKVQRTGV